MVNHIHRFHEAVSNVPALFVGTLGKYLLVRLMLNVADITDNRQPRLMRKVLNSEAVQNKKSVANRNAQQTAPKNQYPMSSLANDMGIINRPTNKSDTAKTSSSCQQI